MVHLFHGHLWPLSSLEAKTESDYDELNEKRLLCTVFIHKNLSYLQLWLPYLPYLDTSTPYHSCPKIWTRTIYRLMLCLKNYWKSGKQCGPWWDATFCGISSGSTLFAQACLSEYIAPDKRAILINTFLLLQQHNICASTWQNLQNGMCTQQRLRSASASAHSDQSSLSAWRKLGSLATNWEHSEDWSDWVDAQADLSLRWAHMPFCR